LAHKIHTIFTVSIFRHSEYLTRQKENQFLPMHCN